MATSPVAVANVPPVPIILRDNEFDSLDALLLNEPADRAVNMPPV